MQEQVAAPSQEAMEGFEAAGEMDQVYAMEDVAKRARQGRMRADHCKKGEEAVRHQGSAMQSPQGAVGTLGRALRMPCVCWSLKKFLSC